MSILRELETLDKQSDRLMKETGGLIKDHYQSEWDDDLIKQLEKYRAELDIIYTKMDKLKSQYIKNRFGKKIWEEYYDIK